MVILLYVTGFNMYLLLYYVDNINQNSNILDDSLNQNIICLIQNSA